ncbi:hypothetical protein ACFLYV_04550 [Chloroflexota bacterium]
MSVVAGIAGELFVRVVVVSRASHLREHLGVRPCVRLVRPTVERALFPDAAVILRTGSGLIVIEVEVFDVVHPGHEETIAQGIFVATVVGVFVNPLRGSTLAPMGAVALATQLIARLSRQVLGQDDTVLIRARSMLRAGAVATLARDVEVFELEVRDHLFIVADIFLHNLCARGVAPSAVTRHGVFRIGPVGGALLHEFGHRHIVRTQKSVAIRGGTLLMKVHGHIGYVVYVVIIEPVSYAVVFGPLANPRHVLHPAHVALLAFTEVGMGVGLFMIGICPSLTPVPLAAVGGCHRDENGILLRIVRSGVLFILPGENVPVSPRAVEVVLCQNPIAFRIEFEKIFSLSFVIPGTKNQVHESFATLRVLHH